MLEEVKPFKVSVETLRLDIIKILPLVSPLNGNLWLRKTSSDKVITPWG